MLELSRFVGLSEFSGFYFLYLGIYTDFSFMEFKKLIGFNYFLSDLKIVKLLFIYSGDF